MRTLKRPMSSMALGILSAFVLHPRSAIAAPQSCAERLVQNICYQQANGKCGPVAPRFVANFLRTVQDLNPQVQDALCSLDRVVLDPNVGASGVLEHLIVNGKPQYNLKLNSGVVGDLATTHPFFRQNKTPTLADYLQYSVGIYLKRDPAIRPFQIRAEIPGVSDPLAYYLITHEVSHYIGYRKGIPHLDKQLCRETNGSSYCAVTDEISKTTWTYENKLKAAPKNCSDVLLRHLGEQGALRLSSAEVDAALKQLSCSILPSFYGATQTREDIADSLTFLYISKVSGARIEFTSNTSSNVSFSALKQVSSGKYRDKAELLLGLLEREGYGGAPKKTGGCDKQSKDFSRMGELAQALYLDLHIPCAVTLYKARKTTILDKTRETFRVADCKDFPYGGNETVQSASKLAIEKLTACLANLGSSREQDLRVLKYMWRDKENPITVECSKTHVPELPSLGTKGAALICENPPRILLNRDAFTDADEAPKPNEVQYKENVSNLPSVLAHEMMHFLGYIHGDYIARDFHADLPDLTQECCFKGDSKACELLKSLPTAEYNAAVIDQRSRQP